MVVSLVPKLGNAVITTTVMDAASNTWTETWTVHVANVDDAWVNSRAPFPSSTRWKPRSPSTSATSIHRPASHHQPLWATVDLATGGVVRLTALPARLRVRGRHDRDDTRTDRTLDLDVRALADLNIDDLVAPSAELEAGSIVDIVVYVQESGRSPPPWWTCA